MGRFFLALGCGLASPAKGQEPVLTRLQDFWDASEDEREAGLAYRFEVDVLYYDSEWRILQVQDDSLAEYMLPEQGLPIESGQRVVITGRTRAPATTLAVLDASFEVLGEAVVKWEPINVAVAPHRSLINRPVQITGLVEKQTFDGPAHLQLSLVCDGRRMNAWVLLDPLEPVPEYAGMMVTVRGVHAARLNGQGVVTALDMFSPGLNMVDVEGPLASSVLFDRSVVPMKDLATRPTEQPVKVVGSVTRRLEEGRWVLRDDSGQIEVQTEQREVFEPGQRVEVVGFPQVEGVVTKLVRALMVKERDGLATGVVESGRVLHRIAATALELPPEQAARRHPVRLDGVVTWSDPRSTVFYLHDSSGGIGVNRASAGQPPPLPGRHVAVSGVTMMGDYAPMVQAAEVVDLGEIELPRPRRVTLEHVLTGVEEAQWVQMSGFVRLVRRDGSWARLELTTTAGPLIARLPADERVVDLVGAVVTVQGVCTAVTDDDRKLTGIELWVPSLAEVELVDEGTGDLAGLPLRALGAVGRFNTVSDQRRRIKVEGTVLHWSPSGWVYLQDGDQRLMVQTRQSAAMAPGSRVEAAGFQGREGGRTVLRETIVRRIGEAGLPEALALLDLHEVRRDWDGRRVRLKGRVVDRFRTGGVSMLALQSGRTVFECELVRSEAMESLPATGSVVEVEGVYAVVFDDRSRPVSFRLLLHDAAQIATIEPPRWWTMDRILVVAGLLVGGVGLTLGWVWTLQRRVSTQAYEINEQIRRSTQLELELQRALRLESLGSLAGGIAHDFNKQLTVITDQVHGLGGAESLSAEGARRLAALRLAALKARDLTHRLLTFAKGGAPVFEAVDLVGLVTETLANFAKPENVKINVRWGEAAHPVWADGGQLKQLVQNLLLNACQAMTRGGNLTIETTEEMHDDENDSLLPPGRYVKLVVQDNGEGIADRNLAQVFDPYFTTRDGAQGLGLAVVFTIARRHGGKVSINSKAMVGTAVEVWLPVQTPAAAPASAGLKDRAPTESA